MKGMELSRKFYNEVLKSKFDELNIPYACGLFGYGSECYGYDDNISQDHDFSAMPVILLSHENYVKYKEKFNEIINNLDKTFMGYKLLDETVWGKNRRGVLDISEYVFSFLGSESGPNSDIEYRNIPQYLLSSFTNGEVFYDTDGSLTKLREKVKFYPRDIRFNMMATRCMQINSSYVNYERMVKRHENVAAYEALSIFIQNSIEMYFLIHKRYAPYYKWHHKMLLEIDKKAYDLINSLVDNSLSTNDKINTMDKISSDIIDKLEEEDVVIRIADFIGYYGDVIQSRIKDESIKSLGCWRD
ncbi:DUF4037 domain-containing protein [Oceanivirga miroungae]|uniref:DUF4037 domain-containing protein n=1 Tax=Oceanivirga miroungae TaxID=1130046 RepID=A0A6I8ME58_9FUSO|nr:DUF4037 domain-containing protein [Oceanivirga miroungae]VWL85860.1 hypothetical protein OMES3154_01146 [Oceanivirga miroungae]